jgi:hypothetical protein
MNCRTVGIVGIVVSRPTSALCLPQRVEADTVGMTPGSRFDQSKVSIPAFIQHANALSVRIPKNYELIRLCR